MKKLFSMALIFTLALTLVGCSTTEVDDLELKVTELNAEIKAYQSIVNVKTNENSELVDELNQAKEDLNDLETELALLQSQIFDNVITFSLKNEHGSFSSTTVGYNDGFDGTLFDLLNDNLEVGYSDSEYGKYVYSLEDLSPKTGAYISFSKNGVPSMVGVESSTFEDGDIFAFEVVWWDSFQKSIDDLIQLFIENHASDYVNDESMDYNVLLALNLLGITNNFVEPEEVKTFVNDSTLTFVGD